MIVNPIPKKTEFLWDFHYFRAFAIINIIIIHVWTYPVNKPSSIDAEYLDMVRETLFDGSTIYFILISGFLFQHLSSKFKLEKYYFGKLKNIIFPYLLLSLIIVGATTFMGTVTDYSLINFISKLPNLLLMGLASGPYWYMPFILIIFLFSPLFLKIPGKFILSYFPFLLILPLLGTRTGVTITLWQYLYFLPIYLYGMYLSINYENTLALIKKYQLALFVIAGITFYVVFYMLSSNQFNNHPNLYNSIVFVKNMSLSFLVLLLFNRIKDKRIAWLDYFARYSFALYFIHDFLHRNVLMKPYFAIGNMISEDFRFTLSIFYVFIFLVVSLAICIFLKKLLGNYSRYFIGV
jgi:surface polysaccharide O-acyltransferase-like enzyme